MLPEILMNKESFNIFSFNLKFCVLNWKNYILEYNFTFCLLHRKKTFCFLRIQLIFHYQLFSIWLYAPEQIKAALVRLADFRCGWTCPLPHWTKSGSLRCSFSLISMILLIPSRYIDDERFLRFHCRRWFPPITCESEFC